MLRLIKGLFLAVVLVIAAGLAWFAVSRESIPDLAGSAPRSTALSAPDFARAIERSRADVIRTRLTEFYPSVTVSVRRNGDLLWDESLGYADLKTRTPATPETLYPIGSVSKPFTASAVMRLAEAGVVDLDAPVGTYAPDLPEPYRAVTLRQLLSHMAGVRHYKLAFTPPVFTENGLNKEFASVEDSLSIFIDDPLLFEPDTSFSYSTYGYTLASYILEKAAGKPFLGLMSETVFQPLGLTHIQPDRKDAPAARSTDYLAMLRRVGLVQSPPTNSSYKWAGGGFLSTPSDLAKFGDALLSGGFLSDEAFAEMTTIRTLPNGEMNEQQYGLGFRIGTMTYPRGAEETVPIVHHGGTAAGSECALLLAPTLEISVGVCANAFTGGSGPVIVLAATVARNFEDEIRGVETP